MERAKSFSEILQGKNKINKETIDLLCQASDRFYGPELLDFNQILMMDLDDLKYSSAFINNHHNSDFFNNKNTKYNYTKLFLRIAHFYYQHCCYNEARTFIEQVPQSIRDDSKVKNYFYVLYGKILHRLDEFIQAEKAYLQVNASVPKSLLGLFQRSESEIPKKLKAIADSCLAAMYREQEKRIPNSNTTIMHKVKQLFEEAERMKIQLYGKSHPETGLTILAYANYFYDINDFQAAIQRYEQACGIFLDYYKKFGYDEQKPHIYLASTWYRYGNCLRVLDKKDDAIHYLNAALKYFQNSPLNVQRLLRCHLALAKYFIHSNELHFAGKHLQLCQESILSNKNESNELEPLKFNFFDKIDIEECNGKLAYAKSNYEIALNHFDTELKLLIQSEIIKTASATRDMLEVSIREKLAKALGYDTPYIAYFHRNFAVCLYNLGLVHYRQGDWEVAQLLQKESLRINLRRFAKTEEEIQIIDQLHVPDFYQYFQTNTSIFESLKANKQVKAILCLQEIARIEQRKGNVTLAISLLKFAEGVQSGVYGDIAHPESNTTLCLLARCYFSQVDLMQKHLAEITAIKQKLDSSPQQYLNVNPIIIKTKYLWYQASIIEALEYIEEQIQIYKSANLFEKLGGKTYQKNLFELYLIQSKLCVSIGEPSRAKIYNIEIQNNKIFVPYQAAQLHLEKGNLLLAKLINCVHKAEPLGNGYQECEQSYARSKTLINSIESKSITLQLRLQLHHAHLEFLSLNVAINQSKSSSYQEVISNYKNCLNGYEKLMKENNASVTTEIMVIQLILLHLYGYLINIHPNHWEYKTKFEEINQQLTSFFEDLSQEINSFKAILTDVEFIMALYIFPLMRLEPSQALLEATGKFYTALRNCIGMETRDYPFLRSLFERVNRFKTLALLDDSTEYKLEAANQDATRSTHKRLSDNYFLIDGGALRTSIRIPSITQPAIELFSNLTESIHTILHKNKLCAILGPAAIGKSHLAAKHCQKVKNYYTHVFWLNAGTDVQLYHHLRKVAREIGISTIFVEDNQLVNTLKEVFQQTPGTFLFVLDGLTNIDSFQAKLDLVVGANSKHDFLVTCTQTVTKIQKIKFGDQILNFDDIKLSLDMNDIALRVEAETFLLNNIVKSKKNTHIDIVTEKQLKELARLLHYHTLSIQLASYLLYKKSQDYMQKLIKKLKRIKYEISDCVQLLVKKLLEDAYALSEESKEFIKMACLMDVDYLHQEFVEDLMNQPFLKENSIKRRKVNNNIEESGLVSNYGDYYIMHKLVQGAIRKYIEQNDKEKNYIKKALISINEKVTYNRPFLETVLKTEKYVLHAETLLESNNFTLNEMAIDLNSVPIYELLFKTAGYYLYYRRNPEKALNLLKLYKVSKNTFEAACQDNLKAYSYLMQEDYAKAWKMARQAENYLSANSCADDDKNHENYKLRLIETRYTLSKLHAEKEGDYSHAKDILEKLRDEVKSLKRVSALDQGIVAHEMGNVYQCLAQKEMERQNKFTYKNLRDKYYGEAINHFNVANNGIPHPRYIKVLLSQISAILKDNNYGSFAQANTLLQRTVEFQKTLYGDAFVTHIDTGEIFLWQGYNHYEAGDYAEAIKNVQQALKIIEAYYHNTPSMLLIETYQLLGRIYLFIGEYKIARDSLSKCYNTAKKRYEICQTLLAQKQMLQSAELYLAFLWHTKNNEELAQEITKLKLNKLFQTKQSFSLIDSYEKWISLEDNNSRLSMIEEMQQQAEQEAFKKESIFTKLTFYLILADVCFAVKHYEEMLSIGDHLIRQVELHHSERIQSHKGVVYLLLARANFALGQLEEANENFKKLLLIHKEIGIKKEIFDHPKFAEFLLYYADFLAKTQLNAEGCIEIVLSMFDKAKAILERRQSQVTCEKFIPNFDQVYEALELEYNYSNQKQSDLLDEKTLSEKIEALVNNVDYKLTSIHEKASYNYSRVYNIPELNDFIDRKTEEGIPIVIKVGSNFNEQSSSSPTVVELIGPRGHNKKLVAFRYAKLNYLNYEAGIFWIKSDTKNKFISDLKDLLKVLDNPENYPFIDAYSEKKIYKEVVKFLSVAAKAQKKMLFIFSDLNTHDFIKPLALDKLHHDFLIIWNEDKTHEVKLVNPNHAIHVGAYNKQEQTAVIEKIGSETGKIVEIKDKDAENLGETLAWQPQAIETAIEYIKVNKVTIDQYIKHYYEISQLEVNTISSISAENYHKINMSIQWRMLIDRIRKTSNIKVKKIDEIFYTLACYHFYNIPKSLFDTKIRSFSLVDNYFPFVQVGLNDEYIKLSSSLQNILLEELNKDSARKAKIVANAINHLLKKVRDINLQVTKNFVLASIYVPHAASCLSLIDFEQFTQHTTEANQKLYFNRLCATLELLGFMTEYYQTASQLAQSENTISKGLKIIQYFAQQSKYILYDESRFKNFYSFLIIIEGIKPVVELLRLHAKQLHFYAKQDFDNAEKSLKLAYQISSEYSLKDPSLDATILRNFGGLYLEKNNFERIDSRLELANGNSELANDLLNQADTNLNQAINKYLEASNKFNSDNKIHLIICRDRLARAYIKKAYNELKDNNRKQVKTLLDKKLATLKVNIKNEKLFELYEYYARNDEIYGTYGLIYLCYYDLGDKNYLEKARIAFERVISIYKKSKRSSSLFYEEACLGLAYCYYKTIKAEVLCKHYLLKAFKYAGLASNENETHRLLINEFKTYDEFNLAVQVAKKIASNKGSLLQGSLYEVEKIDFNGIFETKLEYITYDKNKLILFKQVQAENTNAWKIVKLCAFLNLKWLSEDLIQAFLFPRSKELFLEAKRYLLDNNILDIEVSDKSYKFFILTEKEKSDLLALVKQSGEYGKALFAVAGFLSMAFKGIENIENNKSYQRILLIHVKDLIENILQNSDQDKTGTPYLAILAYWASKCYQGMSDYQNTHKYLMMAKKNYENLKKSNDHKGHECKHIIINNPAKIYIFLAYTELFHELQKEYTYYGNIKVNETKKQKIQAILESATDEITLLKSKFHRLYIVQDHYELNEYIEVNIMHLLLTNLENMQKFYEELSGFFDSIPDKDRNLSLRTKLIYYHYLGDAARRTAESSNNLEDVKNYITLSIENFNKYLEINEDQVHLDLVWIYNCLGEVYFNKNKPFSNSKRANECFHKALNIYQDHFEHIDSASGLKLWSTRRLQDIKNNELVNSSTLEKNKTKPTPVSFQQNQGDKLMLIEIIRNLLKQHDNDPKALFKSLSEKGITWSSIKQELLFKQGLTNDERRAGKDLVRQLLDKRIELDQMLYEEAITALFPKTKGYDYRPTPDGVVEKDLNGFKVKFYKFLVFDKMIPFTEHNPTANPHLVVEIKAPGSQELTSDIDTTLSIKNTDKISLAAVKWPDAWELKAHLQYDKNILLQAALISYYNQLNQTYFQMTSGESRDANVYADGFLNEQGYPKPKASLVGFEPAELAKLDISVYQHDKHQLELAASLVSLCEYFELINKSDEWDSFVIDLQQLWANQTNVDAQQTQEFNTRITAAFAKAKELGTYKKEKLEAYVKDNFEGYVSPLQGEALIKDKEVEAMNKLYEQHLLDLSIKIAEVKVHKDKLNDKKAKLTNLKPNITSLEQALEGLETTLKNMPDNETIKATISQTKINLANSKGQEKVLAGEMKQIFDDYTKLIIEQFERQVKTNLFANEAYVNQSAPYHVVLGLQSKNTELPLDKKRIVMGSILQEIGFRLLHAEQLRKAHQAEGLILYQTSKYGNRVAEMLFGQLGEFYDNKIFTEDEIRTIKDTGSIKVLTRLKNDNKSYHQQFSLAEYKVVNADTDFVVNVKRDASIDLDRKAGKAEYLFKHSLFKHLHPNQPYISDNDVNAVDLRQFRAKITADVKNWLSIVQKVIVYTFESKIEQKTALWGSPKP